MSIRKAYGYTIEMAPVPAIFSCRRRSRKELADAGKIIVVTSGRFIGVIRGNCVIAGLHKEICLCRGYNNCNFRPRCSIPPCGNKVCAGVNAIMPRIRAVVGGWNGIFFESFASQSKLKFRRGLLSQ